MYSGVKINEQVYDIYSAVYTSYVSLTYSIINGWKGYRWVKRKFCKYGKSR